MQEHVPNCIPNFDDVSGFWLPCWWESPWVWCAALIGSMVLSWLLYRLYVIWCNKKERPIDIVVRRINVLKQEIYNIDHQSYDTLQAKKLYVEFLCIIKYYLETRYALDVISKTDDELLEFLDEKQLQEKFPEIVQWHGLLLTVVQVSTVVKFGCAQAEHAFILNNCNVIDTMIKTANTRRKNGLPS